MNGLPTAPTLPVLAPDQAKASGYKPITTPISIKTEFAIFAAMEAGMASCDAVWISQGRRSKFSLARRASELLTNGGKQ